MTKDEILNSDEYRKWVSGDVVTIHELYVSGGDNCDALLVITKLDDLFTITRLFVSGKKVQVSIDYPNIAAEKVITVLLDKYTEKLP